VPTTTPRFGYLTTNMTKLRAARDLALLVGCAVDLFPLDAPAPEPGAFDGLIAEFAPNAPHKLARELFLAHLVQLAKEIPVAVHDATLTPAEAGALRAAGIRRYVVLKEATFAALLAHPLAAKPPVPPTAGPDDAPAPVPAPDPKPDDTSHSAAEVTAG
jgi:hypothetical protein